MQTYTRHNPTAATSGPCRRAILWLSVAAVLALAACSEGLPYRARGEVVRTYRHDPAASTQGLVFDGEVLFESTGLYGRSSLRRVDLESGEVLQIRRLPENLFGEGCTVWDDTIIQLTYKSGLGFVYDKESFTVERRFEYSGEGWGLTHDGQILIMSDGTSYLRFLNPETLEETGRVQVVDKGQPVEQLNELEWIDGQVWANVWQTPLVVRIDPESGRVLGWIDFSELVQREPRGVLNGIATKGEQVFVTGKQWTSIYQVETKPDKGSGEAR